MQSTASSLFSESSQQWHAHKNGGKRAKHITGYGPRFPPIARSMCMHAFCLLLSLPPNSPAAPTPPLKKTATNGSREAARTRRGNWQKPTPIVVVLLVVHRCRRSCGRDTHVIGQNDTPPPSPPPPLTRNPPTRLRCMVWYTDPKKYAKDPLSFPFFSAPTK